MANLSTIIKRATVLNGSITNEPFRADIGIEGDRIYFVGNLDGETAPEEIDASGLYAAPGFIDITSHSDTHWTLFSKPTQESLLRQGITSILGGNCGASLAPITKPSDIADFQKWSDSENININWQSNAEFFTELKRTGLGLNFAALAGHGTLRRALNVPSSRAANKKEKEGMLYLLDSALKEGARGLSTSLGRGYALNADDMEMSALFSAVKKYQGLTAHHLEDEGTGIVSAVSRIISLTRASGAKTHLSHFKTLGRASWPKQKTALELIGRAREDGLEITLDFFPYTSTGSALELFLPEWAREGGKEETLKRFRDKEIKNKIIRALKSLTLHYEKIIVASTLKKMGIAGKSLETLAKDAATSPEEILAYLLEVNELQVNIFSEAMSEENILELAKKNYSVISSDGFGLDSTPLKDSLSHPRSFGAFPRALKMLVKEKKVLSWSEAIHKMTGLPAEILGLEGRGAVKNGAVADIVLFNPETITDEADYQTPNRFSKGVEHLFINGERVLADAKLTGKRSGRILTK